MSFVLDKNDMLFISDQQKATIITACVAAVMADGQLNATEVAKMEQEINRVPWGMPQEFIIEVIKAARQNLSELKDAAGVKLYITRTAATLPPGPIREKTLYLIASIIFADKSVNEAERLVMHAFAEAFAIPPDRLQAIATAVEGG